MQFRTTISFQMGQSGAIFEKGNGKKDDKAKDRYASTKASRPEGAE